MQKAKNFLRDYVTLPSEVSHVDTFRHFKIFISQYGALNPLYRDANVTQISSLVSL